MSGFDVVGTARLSYEEDEMDPESARENLVQMVQDGTISLETRIEPHEEEND